jgi:hypothetical protein
MEGVVVSRQILVGASALTRRPVLKTLCNKGFNQCRQRSTTKKPAMASEPVLFQPLHQILTVLNFGLQLFQINAGRVPQPASPEWRQNQFRSNTCTRFQINNIFITPLF